MGELELVEHADYDKYEIRVRVKFRAEEALQTLVGCAGFPQGGAAIPPANAPWPTALTHSLTPPQHIAQHHSRGWRGSIG